MPTPKAPKRRPKVPAAPVSEPTATNFFDVLQQFMDSGQAATFTFEKGTTVRLNKLTEAVYVSLMSEQSRPKPPTRKVTYLGGAVVEEPRGDDEPVLSDDEIAALDDSGKQDEERAYAQYRQDLDAWARQRGWQFWSTLFIFGVADSPPADVVEMFRWMGFTHPLAIKYQWLASLLADGETDRFIEAVISHTVPTEGGLSEAKDMFPRAVETEHRDRVAGPGDVAAPSAEAERDQPGPGNGNSD